MNRSIHIVQIIRFDRRIPRIPRNPDRRFDSGHAHSARVRTRSWRCDQRSLRSTGRRCPVTLDLDFATEVDQRSMEDARGED